MKYAIAAVSVGMFLFVAARAVHVPLTYDEAAAYIRYIDTSVPSAFDTNVLSVFNFEVATNHFLNTVLTKVVYVFGGRSEWALRLPSLSGYVLYLVFASLILQRMSNQMVAFGTFLLLNLNPYVLDFFALSRGYGLSLGLVMGAVFFLLCYLDGRATGQTDAAVLSRALGLACAAVMANFALLNVYVSIVVVLLLMDGLFTAASTGPPKVPEQSATRSLRPFVWLGVTTLLFVPLVLSHDVALSESLYEPVVVRLIGIDDNVLDRVVIIRVDIHGRESALYREAGAREWRLIGHHVRGLRIQAPRDLATGLTRVEVVIGDHAFSGDPALTDAWTTRDVGDLRVFESAPPLSVHRSRVPAFRSVINWSGDAVYFSKLALATLKAGGSLVAFAVLLWVAGSVVVRTNVVRAAEWRIIALSALWVAVLAGPPLYLLERNSELYFGGTRGLIADTFTSIVVNSFYGKIYTYAQVAIVLTFTAAVVASFLGVLVQLHRRNRLSLFTPANVLLAILVMTSTSLIVQHLIFHTVYLAGRTALFYLPLFFLFFGFVFDRLAGIGRGGTTASMIVVTVAVTLAAIHFFLTANLKYFQDWKDDASTKWMIEDVSQFGGRPSSPTVVGVAAAYVPVAVYYARRSDVPIEIVVVPTTRTIDFLYSDQRNLQSVDLISRYPLTGTSLVRIRH